MTSEWSPAGDRVLRVGLVGLGSMGRNHVRVLGMLADVTLVAVADPDRDALAGVTRRPRAPRASPSRWPCSPRRSSTRW